ncbi:glycosyltransferase family 2 protein [Rhizobium sp. AAP116]|uniref:glycosyltransferase family 2 protein n=1 Tax=Rhizobium sp. AAP116 TaxID=1523429 RepID=UPI0006B8F269|nr:glycosyltransferase family 2 protein [Rhizobium sp. AAP116]KPF59341.1 glycosyl transferase [Rhizobium sp. AAP116]
MESLSRLKCEARLLHVLGISKPMIARMAKRAAVNGTSVEAELLASGTIEEEAYFAGLARMYGLPFLPEIDPSLLVDHAYSDTQLAEPRMLRLHYSDRPPIVAIAPHILNMEGLAKRFGRNGPGAGTLVVTTPTAIRRASWKVGENRRVGQAVRGLFDTLQPLSARLVVTGDQGFVAGAGLCLICLFSIMAPMLAAVISHLTLSLFHTAALLLRMAAVSHGRRPRVCEAKLEHGSDVLPVYTVMVALYREADVVPQLLAALDELEWPRSLLDVKLVCEADDHETIEAIRRSNPGPHVEVVAVPAMAPRTKPKALTYALAGARGEFLTIYDAEDRPHPQQLREAYHAFRLGPPDLACLQAPLVIGNAGESWISAIFALEYSALFRRLLPALGYYRMPLPLGGTSNHFKTALLRASGGWDPYNVTEDADLGMRLYRMGYRSSTLTLPTYEDAPTDFRIWLAQRTRWYKGWLQTWLVLMRQPLRTARDMGFLSFLVFQLLVGGMLIAALSHPGLIVFLTLLAVSLMQVPVAQPSLFTTILLAMDIFNILGSYAIFFVLGATPMSKGEKEGVGWKWAMIPVYWMAVSLAAWKAVIELRLKPFHWNKTPHRPSRAILPASE